MAITPRPSRRAAFGSPYAHLAGVSAVEPDENRDDTSGEYNDNPPPVIEDDEQKYPAGENTDPEQEGRLSEDEMDEEDRKADEEDEQEAAEDTDDEKEVRKSAISSCQSRCKAILRRPEARLNLPLALHLAFDTKTTRVEAVRTLKAAVSGRASGRHSRSSRGGSTASLRSRMDRTPVRPARPGNGPASGLSAAVERLNSRNA